MQLCDSSQCCRVDCFVDMDAWIQFEIPSQLFTCSSPTLILATFAGSFERLERNSLRRPSANKVIQNSSGRRTLHPLQSRRRTKQPVQCLWPWPHTASGCHPACLALSAGHPASRPHTASRPGDSPPPEGNQNKHFRRKEGLDLSETNQGLGHNVNQRDRGKEFGHKPVSYTHLTLPTIYSV